jgi:uncharacterized integral membrane protein (TIGR00697 family)
MDTNYKNLNYFLIFGFLSLICLIISNLTSYKTIEIFGIEASLGTFTMPIVLMLINPIAEIYGKNKADQIIIMICICEIIFSLTFTILSSLQNDCMLIKEIEKFNQCTIQNKSYLIVSENITRGAISFSIGCIIGNYFNTKFLIYLKNLWESKFYFVRDIFSSIIGETIHTIICFSIAFYGVFSIKTIITMLIFSLSFKFFSIVILSPLSQLIVFAINKNNKPSKNKFSSSSIRI